MAAKEHEEKRNKPKASRKGTVSHKRTWSKEWPGSVKPSMWSVHDRSPFFDYYDAQIIL